MLLWNKNKGRKLLKKDVKSALILSFITPKFGVQKMFVNHVILNTWSKHMRFLHFKPLLLKCILILDTCVEYPAGTWYYQFIQKKFSFQTFFERVFK